MELDYRAFLWWAQEDLAVLPLQTYGPDSFDSAAVGLRVESRTALAEVGRVNPAGDDATVAQEFGGAVPVLRSVVIGDRLFVVSYAGVHVADLATLQPRAFVPA